MGKQSSWRKRLQARGYRLTTPREAIITMLSKTNDHVSAEDIYMGIHKNYPSIGLTTIYRTLDLLTQMGIVLKFDFGDSRTRYELTEGYGTKKHHHHLICNKCTRIFDYSDFVDEELDLVKKTEKEIAEKYNFNVTGHMISFTGLCNDCKK